MSPKITKQHHGNWIKITVKGGTSSELRETVTVIRKEANRERALFSGESSNNTKAEETYSK